MKRTSLRLGLFLVLASLTCFARAAPITLTGELTTDDFLATDLYGTFYYDLYEISNFSASSVLVDLTLRATTPLTPWLAYWATQVLPVPSWQSPNDLYVSALWLGPASDPGPGASITVPQFTLSTGSTYQLAVGSFFLQRERRQARPLQPYAGCHRHPEQPDSHPDAPRVTRLGYRRHRRLA